MFLLFSGDPNAWRDLREETLSETLDQSKYKPSLAEILSLAADGYQVGLTWNKSHMPANSYGRDVRESLIGKLCINEVCWDAWHAGFYQGVFENPNLREIDRDKFHCFEVLDASIGSDPRCTCTFGPIS